MNLTNDTKPYKNQYLIYARKSTDDLDNQKNTLAYQVSEDIKFAKHQHLPIAQVDISGFCTNGVIKESHTGFKEDIDFAMGENNTVTYKIERPKFFQLIKNLKEGNFKGVIFLCWDRASRNKNDDGILRKLMKQGVDIKFVQANYDNSSAGALHMDVDGMFAQNYSRIMSEKITNQNRKLREEGVCIYKAPVGYINNGDSRNKPFDPVRAPIVKAMFEKYAEGSWTLRELADWANKQGLTMPPVRRQRTMEERLSDEEVEIEPTSRPLTYTTVQVILTNPFYIGKIKDTKLKTTRDSVSHEPLISEQLFNQVRAIMKKKKVSVHYIDKPYYAYRGMLRCADCGRVYTPYEQKGIHYYGARCKNGCQNTRRSINASYIEDKIGEKLKTVFFTDKELKEIDTRCKSDIKKLESNQQKQIIESDRSKKKILEDLSYLRENKLSLLRSSVYSADSFLTEEAKLNTELQKIYEVEQTTSAAIHEVMKDLVLLSELLKDAYLYYQYAKTHEKKEIIEKIFSELYLSGDTLTYKAKKGFRLLEKDSVLSGGPYRTRTCHLLIANEAL
jgi:site-specific DNA recombinase